MSIGDVIERHPLRLLDQKTALPEADLSIILARSGVGKSAAAINFALDHLQQGKRVFHFSAGMDSEKVHQYYQNIWSDLKSAYPDDEQASWFEINRRLIVISYREAGNMVDNLREEIQTILDSAHMAPGLLIVDGIDFDEHAVQSMEKIHQTTKDTGFKTLATMTIHRTASGGVALDAPVALARTFSDHNYYLEPTTDHIKVEFFDKTSMRELPIHFCPHRLIFRKS